MNGTKEADLVTAVVLYAMRCLAEGDQSALSAMRFGPQEIEALRALNLADLARLGSLQAHCLAIQLDRDVFWPTIQNLQANREAEELQRDLVEADAPLEMMRSLFGMGGREYTRLRRMLTLEPAVGRPPEPDDETAHNLWRALSAQLDASQYEPLAPDVYLAIHKETGASLRAVWNLAQRLLDYGDRYANPNTGAASHPPVPADSDQPRRTARG